MLDSRNVLIANCYFCLLFYVNVSTLVTSILSHLYFTSTYMILITLGRGHRSCLLSAHSPPSLSSFILFSPFMTSSRPLDLLVTTTTTINNNNKRNPLSLLISGSYLYFLVCPTTSLPVVSPCVLVDNAVLLHVLGNASIRCLFLLTFLGMMPWYKGACSFNVQLEVSLPWT